jgi:hypothetical protein
MVTRISEPSGKSNLFGMRYWKHLQEFHMQSRSGIIMHDIISGLFISPAFTFQKSEDPARKTKNLNANIPLH